MAWTDEARSECQKLVSTGDYSTGQIASLINRQFKIGISRNAVIGLIHRRGWDNPRSYNRGPVREARATPAPPRLRVPKPKPPPSKLAVAAGLPEPAPFPLVERIGTLEPLPVPHALTPCRWPIGDPQDATFGWCGRDRGQHRNYCPTHAGIGIKVVTIKVAAKSTRDLDRLGRRYA